MRILLIISVSFLINNPFSLFTQSTVTFNYTGAAQTWTVPACVNTVTVTATGAQGGGTNGGLGALLTGTLAVTPGQVLQINVGGTGTAPGAGWNGGGVGQNATASGCASGPANGSCGGGGASDVRTAPYALANRIIVAAGGGGMGGGDTDAQGGNGDCNTGGVGSSPFGQGGFGGTQTAGGAGGPPWIASGNFGQNGSLGQGGNGATDPCYNVGPGGGGGGGFYGGGGGGSDCFGGCPLGGGGGGGGSSLIPLGGTCTGGSNPGNGLVTITIGAGALTSSVTPTDPNCNGGTGSATVTISGGTSPFTYLWNPNVGSSSSVTGLSAGNYTVVVTDASGCSSTLTFTITQPPALTLSVVSTTTVTCGATNGTATVNGSGGTGTLTYSWSTNPPQSGPTANNLAAGNYTVTLTDANGCTTTLPVTITGSGSYTVNTTQSNINCFGNNNGTASITTIGGTSPYTYLWNTNPAQTTSSLSNLSPGSYTCTITDASGCTQFATFSITQPPLLTTSITASANVSCNGGSDGSATAGPSGGTTPYTYWWTPSGQTIQTVTGLLAGTYSAVVTDSNGCTTAAPVTITEPAPILLSQTTVMASCGLSDGSATVSPSGGISPYSYSWTPGGQATQTINNVPTGVYNVIVTDANGCTNQMSVTVPSSGPPYASFTNDPDTTINLLDATVFFFDLSVNANQWQWDFGDPNNPTSSTDQNPIHVYSDTGTYCVTLIITDAGGACKDTTVRCLRVEAPFTFYIPNAFSPNSDGLNEFFVAYGTFITEFKFWLFNRWGELIWDCQTQGEPQLSSACKWDGKVLSTGETVQEDVYVWKAFIVDVNGRKKDFVGHLTVVR